MGAGVGGADHGTGVPPDSRRAAQSSSLSGAGIAEAGEEVVGHRNVAQDIEGVASLLLPRCRRPGALVLLVLGGDHVEDDLFGPVGHRPQRVAGLWRQRVEPRPRLRGPGRPRASRPAGAA